MKRIEETVLVEAPVAAVWAVLTDTAAYPDWNPFITELTGDLVAGGRLVARIAPPGGRSMVFRPTVTVVEKDHRLQWLGHLGVPGVFDGRHTFTLEPVGEETLVVQGEEFSGALVPFTGAMLRRTQRGFAAMNEALRERVLATAAPAR
jgi:hypothetical protein